MKPEKLARRMLDALDAEIRSVFLPSEMITPDDVRGNSPTLEKAVLTRGWPALEQARGKVVFLLDQRRAGPFYTKRHPSLKHRVLFTNAVPGSPDAAFIEVNNSLEDPLRIPELVRKGYLVRTMTDASPEGVRAGDGRKRDTAMASGAQILSTDYPYGESAAGSGYSVRFESGNARCNPVLQPAACDPDALRERR